MVVCDVCGKPGNGTFTTFTFNGTEYKEVCESCIGRLTTFIKKLGDPSKSNYQKQKERKAARAAEGKVETQTTEEQPEVPEQTEPQIDGTKKKGILGRR
jgi:ribosome-binding protein aMBF1 (putative translation factor)